MPTSLFKITPTPPTSIKLAPGQEGKFSFTVESLAAPDKTHEIILQALLVGEDGKGKEVDWLVPGPGQTLSMAGGETATVTITARPKPTSPRGESKIKLVIADKDRPNDVFADSPTVACEVTTPAGVTTPPRKLPWWLIPAIVGGLVLVSGAVLLVWKLSGDKPAGPPGLGEACASDATQVCAQGLLCVPGVQKCLLTGGATCKPDQAPQCASGECKADVCTIPLGGACSPGDEDVVPCLSKSTCDPATKRCLGTVGAACKVNDECATGNCAGAVCAIKAPAVKAGDPCQDTCPDPLQCSATSKLCVEQIGRPCSNNNQCATGLCEAAICARPRLLRDCTKDAICDLDQKCVDVQPGLKRCVWQPGHACNGDSECSSKWCNQRVCARDDGKCASTSDCRAPALCIMAKNKCLVPDGQVCGGDGECNSGFCKNTRCAPSPCVPACTAPKYCNNNVLKPACIYFSRLPIEIIKRDIPWTIQPGVR